jgi:signal transduction histidine kinase
VPIRSERGLQAVPRLHDAPRLRSARALLLALADRAAVAIETAALFERAQQVASLQERQRLARELHDSVSQALYGIALGARTARTLLDRDPARAIEPVEYVMSLAEAGLTEMRALIFELRPESLETEGLVAAISKQVAATQARYGIQVETALCDEPDLPIEVKEAVHRIAQESLHNTVKHARASRVEIKLVDGVGEIVLEVRDDGLGFDASGSFPGHIGLRSMRERAAKLMGSIEIESAVGAGTRIVLRIPRSPAA